MDELTNKEQMNNKEQEESHKDNLVLNFRLVAIVIVIAVVLTTVWFFYSKKEAINFSPDGSIYLSLREYGGNERLETYRFNFNKNSLEKFISPTDLLSATGQFSPDGDKYAFAAAKEGEEYSQIFISDSNGEDVRQITWSEGVFNKKNPVWSPDQKQIAFIARETRETLYVKKNKDGNEVLSEGSRATEDWRVYITDLDGNERLIAIGLYPQFSPNGDALLVLKDDGLYHVTLDRGILTKIWGTEGGSTYSGMKLDISNDKTMLALSNPVQGNVFLVKIDSWSPFTAHIEDTINNVYGYWPQISPNNDYLALQEVDFDTNDSPRLVIYNLETKQSKKVLDLSRFFYGMMWVNDWQ